MSYKTPSVLSALKIIKQTLSKTQKIQLCVISLLSFISALFEFITAIVVVGFVQILADSSVGQIYINKLGIEKQISNDSILIYSSIGLAAIYLIKNFFGMFEVSYLNFSIQKMNHSFKMYILELYSKMSYQSYLKRNSAQGIQVISGDIEWMFSSAIHSISMLISELLAFVLIIGVMILISPHTAIAIFIFGGLIAFFTSKILMPKYYKFGKLLQESSYNTYLNLVTFFNGFKEILLFNKIEYFIKNIERNDEAKSRVQAFQTSLNAFPRLAIEAIFVTMFVIAILILISQKKSQATILGTLGGYLYAGFRLMPALNRMINYLNTFKASIPSIERIFEEVNLFRSANQIKNINNFKFRKKITISNLDFKYSSHSKKVLDFINLEINKGETVGFIGETGSGKSTLINAILGILQPTKGTILVDDKYIVNSKQWIDMVGYVPQSVYLIDDTIAANIAFGEEVIDYKKVERVVCQAQLQRFIKGLPDGLNTVIGERGMRLSGGERQRISIARALYKNPKVIVFDEATSALDNVTEARLMETINKVSKDRTVIMIAHRLSTLEKCDKVITIHKGKIENITYKGKKCLKTF